MTLRPATPADAATVCELVRELAAYEKASADDVSASADAFAAALAPDASPRLGCLLAEVDGVAAGVAVFFPAFSTWRAGWGLYLEDLFVRPAYRGQGVGLALFRAVAAEAEARVAPCRLPDWVLAAAGSSVVRAAVFGYSSNKFLRINEDGPARKR